VNATGEAEKILCDTSFIGIQERGLKEPKRIAHWPAATMKRLDKAILAISPFSLGEVRAGRIYAGWGEKRAEAQEARLAAFVLIPLDDEVLDVYAELHAWGLRGHPTGHNDLWIAATAISREIPLVSCDEDFEPIAENWSLDHIYLPVRPRERHQRPARKLV
jgi:predicted nucleic acid-binding protein